MIKRFCPVTFSYSLNINSINKFNIKIIDNKEEFFKKIIKLADISINY